MSNPRGRLPLPRLDFHVLLGLLDGPRHAYGLSNAVESSPGPGVRLEIGSLYRILSEGLIEHFSPLASGRQVVRAEASRLEAVLRYARKHKLLPSGGSP